MNFERRILLAVVILAASVPVLGYQSQMQPILLGGIELRIGMPQDDAVRGLSTAYDLVHMDTVPGNWSVVRKGGIRTSSSAL